MQQSDYTHIKPQQLDEQGSNLDESRRMEQDPANNNNGKYNYQVYNENHLNENNMVAQDIDGEEDINDVSLIEGNDKPGDKRASQFNKNFGLKGTGGYLADPKHSQRNSEMLGSNVVNTLANQNQMKSSHANMLNSNQQGSIMQGSGQQGLQSSGLYQGPGIGPHKGSILQENLGNSKGLFSTNYEVKGGGLTQKNTEQLRPINLENSVNKGHFESNLFGSAEKENNISPGKYVDYNEKGDNIITPKDMSSYELYKNINGLSEQDMMRFLLMPAPYGEKIQCNIVREKSFLNPLYPTFHVTLAVA
jgi:hypothetical protein